VFFLAIFHKGLNLDILFSSTNNCATVVVLNIFFRFFIFWLYSLNIGICSEREWDWNKKLTNAELRAK
jgi:hypothetical protein